VSLRNFLLEIILLFWYNDLKLTGFIIYQQKMNEEMNKRGISDAILAVALLLAVALPVQATLITIEIEAIVDAVEDSGNYLEGQISPGYIITGSYVYESTTLDSNPSSSVGDYQHYTSPYGIFLSVGGFNFETDLTNVNFVLEVVNDYPSGDNYLLRSYNNLALSNGTLVEHITWQLDDSTGSALSSDVLPTSPPVLDNWQSMNDLSLYGERAGWGIDATVTSAVPEPSTILLFAFGSMLLRKRRS